MKDKNLLEISTKNLPEEQQYLLDFFMENYPNFDPEIRVITLRMLNIKSFVCIENHEIIAATLFQTIQNVGNIMYLAVKQDYRNQGLGKYIVRQTITHVSDQYKIRIFSTTTANWRGQAYRIFTNLGFNKTCHPNQLHLEIPTQLTKNK